MALTDLAFRKAKPKEKVYLMNDGDGLHLEVKPSGKKHWRYRYWLNGKENRMSLGEYPYITLEKARELREEKKTLVAQGIDPVVAKREWSVSFDESKVDDMEYVAKTIHTIARVEQSEHKIFDWLSPIKEKLNFISGT